VYGVDKVAIIGAGSFGTALAMVLAHSGHHVQLWAREAEIVYGINHRHKNPEYLSDLTLPDTIDCSNSLERCVDDCTMIVFAIPSHALREVARKVKPYIAGNEILVNVAKGIENDTFMTMSQVIADVFKDDLLDDQIGVLSGPSHAEEVGKYKPATVVATSNSKRTARIIQKAFMTPRLRIYLNYDIIGVEIAGAVKNIMAIAAGIIDGAALGDNSKAGVITRGLHEMKRLGMHLGASQDTFSGLSGLGDLVVTCTSRHSRNRHVGYQLGKGKKLDEILARTNMVAEGIKTTRSVQAWSRQLDVEMPITNAVYQILFEGENPGNMLHKLMTRNPKEEILI
jgi:glycerol-3-phosphate dehydrogenase (NAD(P)+)